MTVRSVGVEEELLLVEPGTGRPLAVAETALRTVDAGDGRREPAPEDAGESLQFELQRQQLETGTKPCFDLSELSGELRRGRSLAAEAAGRAGARVTALAASPVQVEPELVRKGRYLQMARAFGLTAYEQLTCGCHVHVSVSGPDEGVAVLDRIRPWLPVLLALSAGGVHAVLGWAGQAAWPAAGGPAQPEPGWSA